VRCGGNWKRDYGDSYTGTQGETLDTAKERPTDYRTSSRPYQARGLSQAKYVVSTSSDVAGGGSRSRDLERPEQERETCEGQATRVLGGTRLDERVRSQ
jgi:hypothetical protein